MIAADHVIRDLFESAPNGVATIGPDGSIGLVNTPLSAMFGGTGGMFAGRPAGELLAEDARAGFLTLCAEVAAGKTGRGRGEFVGCRADGSRFPVEVAITPFKGGRDGTLLLIVVDVTARKAAAARQDLLIGELHHRTQNIFAVIQSVAMRTLRSGRNLEEARAVFLNRLHALSRTYTVLTEGAWEGAQLEQILRDELAGFSGRYEMRGAPVIVQPSAAQTFAMIFHELATNALKYGALSVPSGQLSIGWDITEADEGPRFSFQWTETGGPRVRSPRRKGYGRTILEDGARHIGEPTIAYAPAGLRYGLIAPLGSIGWTAAPRPLPSGG